MMNRKIVLASLMTLALGACSTVNGMGDDISHLFGTNKKASVEKVYSGTSTDGANWVDPKGNPMTPPSKAVDLSYNRMAGEVANNNSSVQMFSLDGDSPAQPVQKIDRRSAGTGSFGVSGVPSATDSSVTVFPFSNDMYTPGIKPGVNGYGRRPEPGSNNYLANTGMADIGNAPMVASAANTIYFAHGSSALSAGARKKIAAIAQNYAGGMVQIDGHASHRTGVKDPVKAELVNFQMSMKRAMGVMRSLMQDGVPAKAMKVTAHGDAEPAVPETDRQAEAKNRRVEINTRP